MPNEITVELNIAQYRRFRAKFDAFLKDATPLMTLIGEELVDAVDERFRNEVDPDGSPWAALSPRYVEWKRKRGFIMKKLQMRGDLRATVAYEASSDRVEIGANTPYARKQHLKRPYIYSQSTEGSAGELGAKDERRVERVAEEYLQALVDEVG